MQLFMHSYPDFSVLLCSILICIARVRFGKQDNFLSSQIVLLPYAIRRQTIGGLKIFVHHGPAPVENLCNKQISKMITLRRFKRRNVCQVAL